MTVSVISPSAEKNLLSKAVACLEKGDAIAMLTLVNIEGSAPYPLGTQMLVTRQGEHWGQITGGCAEVALADQAIAAIDTGQNYTHRYGLNSPFFDIQLPCGSGIDVYFDVRMPRATYHKLHGQLSRRQAVLVNLKTAVGNYQKRYLPTPRLVVFGQGPILLALSQLALGSGIEVVAIAADQATVSTMHNQELPAALLATAQEYVPWFDAHTGIVSLFHEHERELDVLTAALDSPAFYIGALGSQKTHKNRLRALQSRGLSRDQLARVDGPAGMDIKAETPAQIAVSILAKLIAEMPKSRA